VNVLDIGQGYEPGKPLQVADGVTVQLASGSVNNGDTFSTTVVANADTAGILGALGIGAFFQGNSAGTIAVAPELQADPARLAASRTGDAADTSNLARMAALRDASVLGNGTQNFREAYAAMVGDVGATVQQLS